MKLYLYGYLELVPFMLTSKPTVDKLYSCQVYHSEEE